MVHVLTCTYSTEYLSKTKTSRHASKSTYRIYWRTTVHVAFQDIGRAHVKATFFFDLVYRLSWVSSAYVLKPDMDRCSLVDAVFWYLKSTQVPLTLSNIASLKVLFHQILKTRIKNCYIWCTRPGTNQNSQDCLKGKWLQIVSIGFKHD